MIQRWKIYGNQAAAVTEPDGNYVEYADHLAAIAEKDKEIKRLQRLCCLDGLCGDRYTEPI